MKIDANHMEVDVLGAPDMTWAAPGVPEKAPIIGAWARERGWTRLAEIGVKKGETTAYLLEQCPNLTVIAVDIWDAYLAVCEGAGRGALVPRARAQAWEREARERMLPFMGRAIIIKLRSVEAAGMIEDGSLDCVFIDANHTKADVLAEIAAWRPKIKPGGTLAGHDIHVPGVLSAVNKAAAGWQKYDAHIWAVRV